MGSHYRRWGGHLGTLSRVLVDFGASEVALATNVPHSSMLERCTWFTSFKFDGLLNLDMEFQLSGARVGSRLGPLRRRA